MAGNSFRGLVGLALSLGAVPTSAQTVTWVTYTGKFLGDLVQGDGTQRSLADSQALCITKGSACGGVTCTGTLCTLRAGTTPGTSSSGEVSYLKTFATTTLTTTTRVPIVCGMGFNALGVGNCALQNVATARPDIVLTGMNSTQCAQSCVARGCVAYDVCVGDASCDGTCNLYLGSPSRFVSTTQAASSICCMQACPWIEAFYVMTSGAEMTVRQTGCSVNGTDLNGPVFLGGLVPVIAGNVTTWVINATFFSRGSPSYVGQVGNSNNVTGVKWSSGLNMSATPCTRMLAGTWSINGASPVAFIVNPVTCVGTAVTGTGTTAVNFTVFRQTFSVSGQGISLPNAYLTAPDTFISGANVYKLEGPIPCFSLSDYRLTTQCYSSLRTAAVVSAYKAFGNRTMLSDAHNYYCFGPEQKSRQSCPAGCMWDRLGGANGLGACVCLEQGPCVSNGFAWVTKVFNGCDATFRDAIISVTTDCCGATAASICSSFGTLPNNGNGIPGAMGLPAGCKFMPANTIQDFQMATSMKPRRCSTPAPQPLYATPAASPAASPSPSYMPPSPSYTAAR